MPIVLPPIAPATSTPVLLAGQQVYDYILDDSGVGLPNVRVSAQLNCSQATSISPSSLVVAVQKVTYTDANGFWAFSLVPNTNLLPATAAYLIQTPFRTYLITVGANGPYQSTAAGTFLS